MGLNEKRLVMEETFHIPIHVVNNETNEVMHRSEQAWTQSFIHTLLEQKSAAGNASFEKYSTNGIECYYYFRQHDYTFIAGPVIHNRLSLLNSNYMISDIAKLLHFHDQSHFTKVFKKITNYTPKQFRSSYV